jgi:hypothetical protein
VRVLLDENPPHHLAGALTGHVVSTVQEHQQNLASISFGMVIIDARRNRMADLVLVRS